MKELCDIALNVANAAGAEFADMRVVDEQHNRIGVSRRSVASLGEGASLGYGVRVLVNGAWGFASSTDLTKDGVARTADLAVSTARASASVPKDEPARMAPESASVDTCVGPCEEDPFAIPNRDKADMLLAATDAMLGVENIVNAHAGMYFMRRRRVIANTDGSFLDLTTNFAVPTMAAVAVIGDESQSRQYQGGARQAGFEFIREVDLVGNARQVAEEAVQTCKAEDCPTGIMDLVLDPMHLSLTMHESVGHPTELDRILGWEANMAGRSFVQPEHIGNLKYGSELVNFTADNTIPYGVGSWFYDDDGVKLGKFPMIKDGVLVNLSTTRETVPIVGWEKSSGGCRADSFGRMPINRIPNLYMEPGTDDSVTKESLIADVEKGIYIQGMGSFSIDQMRNNFQFGGDVFWMIENGKLTKPLKKVTYQAQTRQFWASCDGVAGPSDWQTHGVMNCGKGEPIQVMYMTHGASHTRFRDISVGGAKL